LLWHFFLHVTPSTTFTCSVSLCDNNFFLTDFLGDWESWVITTDERIKHDAQFQFLKPVNGYVTDMDADGKLDKKEFSIAMFLIRKKLEGMQLPPTLPSGVKSDPQPAFMSSGRSPLSSLSLDTNTPNDKSHSNGVQNVTSNSATINTISPVLSTNTANTSPPAGANDAWSMSPSSRPKYRLLFNQHDRNKRGFITGVEARGIFIKSGLSQQILAHIWNLADLDRDGNLNCDEFCIAAYLIEQAVNGTPPPPTLPLSLLPSPHQASSALARSLNRRTGQTQSVQQQKTTENEDENKASSLSFEDKRRENFRQGQVELDRRKQELAEKLRQEEEARLEKERQERERLENIRLEKERQAAIEAERQAERMRELEAQREVRRRQAVEARTKAWREAEAQRQLEAEKQRVDALKREKSHAQTALEQAIAHRASLLESATAQEQRRRELDARLMVAQNEVDAHKSAINEMRQKRDTYQRDIRELTEQVEAAKAELTRWQREHEQLSLRVSTGVDTNPTAEQCKTLQANRELRRNAVNGLKSQLQELDTGMTHKGQELASRRNRADECERRSSRLQTELTDLRRSLETKVQEYKRTKDPNFDPRGSMTTNYTAELFDCGFCMPSAPLYRS
uniref:Intersectin-2 n=1 Tax=Echinostoma caproni TaxID=27848 RepID=A0A183AV14_9TREM